MKNHKEKHNNKKTILLLAAVVAVFVIEIISGFRISNMTRRQCDNYISELAINKAEELDNTFQSSQESIMTIAHMCAHIMEKEYLDTKGLKHLVNSCEFDKLEYVHISGEGIDMDGNHWECRNEEFYKRGIRGESGYCCAEFTEGDEGSYVIFYAPITTDKGKNYGVLLGYYKADTAAKWLNATYNNEEIMEFICCESGDIIYSNEDTHGYKTVYDYYNKKKLYDAAENQAIKKMFTDIRKGKERDSLRKMETSHVKADRIGNSQFYVVETFPSNTFREMTQNIESESRLVVVCLLLLFLVVALILMEISQREKIRLQKENRLKRCIIEGTQKLNEVSIVVDLEKETYELLGENDKYSFIAKNGLYKNILPYLENYYINADEKKPFSNFMALNHLADLVHTYHGKYTCEFGTLDERAFRGLLHIVLLKQEDASESILISTENITELRKSQTIQKRISEIMFDTTFVSIGLIDLNRQTITIIDCQDEEKGEKLGKEYPYSDVFKQKQILQLTKDDREKYIEKASIPVILHELKNHKAYDFSTTFCNIDGKTGQYMHHFRFYDQHSILYATEDISNRVDYDEITGEFNGGGFERFCKSYLDMIPNKQEYAIAHFDIKGFKAINEKIGFEAANQILRKISIYLKDSELKPAAVCREMADHYYCLVEQRNINFERLNDLCIVSVNYQEQILRIRLNCGIYLVDEKDTHVHLMCDKARLAEQMVDNEYVKPYYIYNSQVHKDYIKKIGILDQLENALHKKEFHIYYQPVFDARTKKLVSAEALIRWIGPDGKIVSPGEFIPVFEEKGHISELDLFVIHTVKQMMERRQESGRYIVPVSMNLSRKDVCNGGVMKSVSKAVRESIVDASYYRFELTETGYVDLTQKEIESLESLRLFGSSIMIDDFGTGYSSLNSLTKQEFDYLKLDMSFVREIGHSHQTEEIIRMIFDLAHRLQVKVIAEGVETEEQYLFLKENNCDYIQGYYFSRPISGHEFEEMLETVAFP